VKTPIALVSRRRFSRESRSRVPAAGVAGCGAEVPVEGAGSGGGALSVGGAFSLGGVLSFMACSACVAPLGFVAGDSAGTLSRDGRGLAGVAGAEVLGDATGGAATSAGRGLLDSCGGGAGPGRIGSWLPTRSLWGELEGRLSHAWLNKIRALAANAPALLPMVTEFSDSYLSTRP